MDVTDDCISLELSVLHRVLTSHNNRSGLGLILAEIRVQRNSFPYAFRDWTYHAGTPKFHSSNGNQSGFQSFLQSEDGPNNAFCWANRRYAQETVARANHKGRRAWGYVMWDNERLEDWALTFSDLRHD